ncbi:MAG: hypothetical protein LBL66_04870 [Clostridiales bacterium]|jgi:hypothetical protein|nr:hypothetical protein [Clostridiales bacterium]
MPKLVKAAAAVYVIGLMLLAVLLPIGGITALLKLTGAAYSWTAACAPFFAALGVAAPVLISKILIELTDGGKK